MYTILYLLTYHDCNTTITCQNSLPLTSNSYLYCASYNTCKDQWHITSNDDSNDDNNNDNEDDNNKNINKIIVIIVV